jgi:hypothetical protein
MAQNFFASVSGEGSRRVTGREAVMREKIV